MNLSEDYRPHSLMAELKHRGKLPFRECVQFMKALLHALASLHREHLVHRDIKPDNILFVEGRPVLADISLVTVSGDELSHVGTKGYIPPEGHGLPRGDIFSLGVVLYQMAAGLDLGRFPKLPANPLPLMRSLNRVIQKACAADPEERYQTADEMLRDMNKL